MVFLMECEKLYDLVFLMVNKFKLCVNVLLRRTLRVVKALAQNTIFFLNICNALWAISNSKEKSRSRLIDAMDEAWAALPAL